MRSLSDTLSRLAKRRAAPSAGGVAEPPGLSRLVLGAGNPGKLQGWYRLPQAPARAPALVVVLHGCTQTAAGYDAGSGWSMLSAAAGFAVLFPEQARGNNANLCFNWFNPADVARDGGELASIREMVRVMVEEHGVDPARVYVTGLSAGGAMAAALLAVSPELFAGGAIIAGLPFGVASSVPEAFDRMRGHGLPPAAVLQQRLLAARGKATRRPTLSVWHGTADTTVVPANAAALVAQWRGVHAVPERATREEALPGGHRRRVWTDAEGRAAIALVEIAGMAHGTPVAEASGYGRPAPFMLETGLSSTLEIARSWDLLATMPRQASAPGDKHPRAAAQTTLPTGSLQKTIEDALRAAGLMR